MANLFEDIEAELDEADRFAAENDKRYTAEEVFGRLRGKTVKMRKIIKNAVKCNHCGDIIVSEHRHDFVRCKCGCCTVDGGHDYLKRGFVNSKEDYTELSEFEEDDT